MPPIVAQDQYVDLAFPAAGISTALAFDQQKPLELPGGGYGMTTPFGKNVRTFDPAGNRGRGGSRGGLSRYVAAAPVAGWLIQDLAQVTQMGDPEADMQQSSSGRIVNLVAVSQGNVYYATAGATTWNLAVNNTATEPPLNFTGVVRSAVNNLKLYFADGNHWCYFDPDGYTVETWTASAGTLPVDGASNKPRLICTWRGRTVLSGLIEDPQNWFMSRANDPTDFDYSPASISPTQAIAGNNAPQGQIGDVITGMCPWSDDILIFFCDHEIWAMRGDPLNGGSLDNVSRGIGGAWGIPWAQDPYGTIYFFGNIPAVYTLSAGGGQPVPISQQIAQFLDDIDTGENTIRLVWNHRYQGLHVFVTPTDTAAAATHFFWEQRTGGWWVDTFADDRHNPLCALTYDGNLPGDRAVLVGSWDGYVRSLSTDATDDDGEDIASEVVLGPLLTPEFDDLMLKEFQAVLAETSGDVNYAVHIGRTPEAALASDPVDSGVWEASRNPTNHVRWAGHAVYVKLSSTDQWAMESIRALVAAKGKVRKRGYD